MEKRKRQRVIILGLFFVLVATLSLNLFKGQKIASADLTCVNCELRDCDTWKICKPAGGEECDVHAQVPIGQHDEIQ